MKMSKCAFTEIPRWLMGASFIRPSLAVKRKSVFSHALRTLFWKRRGSWQVFARHYSRLPPERTAVKLDPKIYDAYVGQYELAPGFVLSVTREGDILMTQATGQPKVELLPESEIGFFIKDISAVFVFMRDEKGEVNQLITIQDGRIIAAKRIK